MKKEVISETAKSNPGIWIPLTIIAVLFILFFLNQAGYINLFNFGNSNANGDLAVTVKTNQSQAANPNTGTAWAKTSGYTVAECEDVCNEWNTVPSVNSCKNTCTHKYGKPSSSLDEFVNMVKENGKFGGEYNGY